MGTRIRGITLSLVLLAALIMQVGCTDATSVASLGPASPDVDTSSFVSEQRSSAEATNTMARSHEVTVKVARESLDAGFQAVLSACNAIEHCTTLSSSIYSGDYPSARLQLRLLPGSVPRVFETATQHGEMIRREASAEDLAKPLFDQAERLSMLRQYMADLRKLRSDATKDVNALIRVASEIAKTQSQIESAEGERAHLQQRVDTEIVSLIFTVDSLRGFWNPVAEAFENFGYDLGEGIASAVTAIAFVLPWLLVLVPALYLLRWIWQRTKPAPRD